MVQRYVREAEWKNGGIKGVWSGGGSGFRPWAAVAPSVNASRCVCLLMAVRYPCLVRAD
jgi:hypothetical protein